MIFIKKKLVLLTCFLSCIPFLVLIFLIYKYGYRFPYWDEILYVSLYQKLISGSLNLSDLLFFQNDHRPMFPRIFTLLLALITHWNELVLLYSSVFMNCLIYLVFISQIRRSPKLNNENAIDITGFLIIISFSLLLFSWTQMENWVWGLQLMVYMCNVSAVGSFYLLSRYELNSPAFYLAILLGVISTFSYASGLLVWISPMILIIYKFLKDKNRNLFPLIMWILFGTLVVILYFQGYSKPGISEVGRNAGFRDYISYFLLFIGGTLNGFFTTPPWHGSETLNPKWFAYLFGILGLLSFFVLLYLSYLLILKNDCNEEVKSEAETKRILFWLSVSLFSLFSGLVITYGRAGLGVGLALSSRYITTSTLFWCGLLGLFRVYVNNRKSKSEFNVSANKGNAFLVKGTILLFGVIYVGLTLAPIKQNEKWHNIARWKNLGWFALCAGYDGKLYWTDLWGTRIDFIDPIIVKKEIFPIFKEYNLCGYQYYNKESVKKELSKTYLKEAKYFIANKLWKPAICYLETALFLNPELIKEVEEYRKRIPEEMFRLYQEYQNRH